MIDEVQYWMGICWLAYAVCEIKLPYLPSDRSITVFGTALSLSTFRTFFSLGDKLDLHWFHKQISDLGVKSQWQALAREAYRDDLEAQQGSITTSVLMSMDDQLQDNVETSIETWLKKSSDAIGRWQHLVGEIRAANAGDFSVYTVANRALTDLAEHCQHNKAA